jgi:hypothetical protein
MTICHRKVIWSIDEMIRHSSSSSLGSSDRLEIPPKTEEVRPIDFLSQRSILEMFFDPKSRSRVIDGFCDFSHFPTSLFLCPLKSLGEMPFGVALRSRA